MDFVYYYPFEVLQGNYHFLIRKDDPQRFGSCDQYFRRVVDYSLFSCGIRVTMPYFNAETFGFCIPQDSSQYIVVKCPQWCDIDYSNFSFWCV